MKRSARLQPVVRAVGHDERDRAATLATAERRVLDAEHRLGELEAYQADYARGLGTRIAAGISATGLRDYQAFLARLGEAVRVQSRIVTEARVERDRAHDEWRIAAQRAKAVDKVVGRWQAEERVALERREQRESDERAGQRRPLVR